MKIGPSGKRVIPEHLRHLAKRPTPPAEGGSLEVFRVVLDEWKALREENFILRQQLARLGIAPDTEKPERVGAARFVAPALFD